MGFDTYYSGWNGTSDLSQLRGRTNVYCGPSERFILTMATNYIQDGLQQLGYNWMCISDGWQGGRDASGEIYADTNRFPNGMAHTIEVLHQLGFKVRLYTEVGEGVTCCGKVKSSGTNGLNDALTFAKWKLDGLTVDTCNDFGSDLEKQAYHEQLLGYFRSNSVAIDYDLHVSPTAGQYSSGMKEWMSQVDSWQYTVEWGTLNDVWLDAVAHIDMASETAAYMRPGHTPNLLIISGDFTAYKGHYGMLLFTFWSMFQSPLVVAEDFISYPGWPAARFQTNRYCIAIDQDGLFAPPVKTFTNGANSEVWVKPLVSGATALAFLNRTNSSENITVDFSAIGVSPGTAYSLTDAWNNTNLQSSATSLTFASPPNSVQLWILHPPTLPRVNVEVQDTNIFLSWPASVPDCFVQVASCPARQDWTNVTCAPFQSGELMKLKLPPTQDREFYRLAKGEATIRP